MAIIDVVKGSTVTVDQSLAIITTQVYLYSLDLCPPPLLSSVSSEYNEARMEFVPGITWKPEYKVSSLSHLVATRLRM